MSAISGPLLQWLEDRLEQNKQRVQELQQEKEQLLEELAALEWGGNADPSGTWHERNLQELLQAEGWPSVASVKVLAVPLLLQQRAQLQDQDFTCPSLVQSSAVSALLAQWWGWAAPEDSCSGVHTPREPVFPSVFWQKSYCFTYIPGAWNTRVRGEIIPDAAYFCLLLVAIFDHDLISGNVLGHWSFTQAGGREAWEQTWKIFDIGSVFRICQTK